jgi:hypothetical protein
MGENLKTDKLKEKLTDTAQYFMQVQGSARFSDGWKLSIQGRTLEDALYLLNELLPILVTTNVSFKIATQRLIDLGGEQSTKMLTIYIPNGVDPVKFAELISSAIPDYKGAEGIEEKESYTKYKNGVFYRNDRDQYGDYIPASAQTGKIIK